MWKKSANFEEKNDYISFCKFRRFLRKKSAIFEEKMECENEKKECDMKKAASEKGGSELLPECRESTKIQN